VKHTATFIALFSNSIWGLGYTVPSTPGGTAYVTVSRSPHPHSTEVLDFTSLTAEEFTALVAPFEAACREYMAEWTLYGRRRQARRYPINKNYPLPKSASYCEALD
jgi:hypothetical protein